ncbi:MAG: tetratricopeptide repeat protein [Halanaerobiaceae bacterium]
MLNFLKNLAGKIKDKIRFKRALKKLNTGEYSSAKKQLAKLLDSQHLEREMVYFNYASTLIGLENFDGAERNLKKAIEIKNNIAFFWGTLGEVHILQKNWDKAEECLERARKLEDKKMYRQKLKIIRGPEEKRKNYLQYYYLIKEALQLQKEEKWEESVNKFREALEYNNSMGYAYNQIGAIYNNKLKNTEKAKKYFRLALEKEPDNKMFKMNLKRLQ